jgi:glycosyltransferase involved in cell wall biosynthesis
MNDIVLSVIIPAYNEEKAIGRVLEDHIKELGKIERELKGWEIVCLNDASTDGTLRVMTSIAQLQPKVRVLSNEQNQGIAAAFNRLFQESRGTHIYVTAGDNQWPASNLSILLRRMTATGSDLVIGVRQNRREVYTVWRQFLSFLFNIVPKLFYRVDTQDANGIKLGRREIFVMPVRSRSFFAEIERIILAHRQGYAITTAPIEFKVRSSGKAKGSSWKNIWMTLRDMVKFMGTS